MAALNGDLIINSYMAWLKDSIQTSVVGEYLQVSTPFLDRHNDHLQIYIKENNGTYTLTDDAYIINDLALSGCEINTEKRRETLRYLLNGFGVELDGEALVIKASRNNIAQKKHFLIQAMLAVDDMFMLSQQRVSGVFLEDVENFFLANGIGYVPSISLVGKSGLTHGFHFVIPKSKRKPERIVHALNSPNKERVKSILFTWHDVSETRKLGAQMYVFLNDEAKEVHPEITGALTEYQVTPILWSKRNQHIQDFVA